MTVTRNECFLIKHLLPVWKKYADGFVFMVDSQTTDDTREYLQANKEQYNILEVFDHDWKVANPHETESYGRQRLFDAAVKHTNNIICLDTDEYIDGVATKDQLEHILNSNPNTTCMLQWIQYTDKNTRRVDSVWRDVFHDRAGNFNKDAKFGKAFSHTAHVPANPRGVRIDPNQIFVAHLQWLDKRWVGIKQYFWKVLDYVHHLEHNVNIIKSSDYDVSVNNFAWSYEHFGFPLQITEDIYSTQSVKDNYKLQYVIECTQKYNIPNLGDWGMGIYDYCIKLQNQQ